MVGLTAVVTFAIKKEIRTEGRKDQPDTNRLWELERTAHNLKTATFMHRSSFPSRILEALPATA